MKHSSRKRGVLIFVLAGIALIGGIIILSSRPQPGATEPPSASKPQMPGAGKTPSMPLPQSLVLSLEIPTRSRAQMVAATRKRIYETRARWTMGWARHGFSAPLPKHQEFWSLIEALKKDLGPEAPAVLSDLIDEAVAPRTKELYAALLAGLKDPSALARLAALASATGNSGDTRGLALYGLGLLGSETAWTAAQGIWEKETSTNRYSLYSGMALFGERAFPLFLKEAESAPKGQEGYAMSWMEPSGVRDRLWEILESTKEDDLRSAAMGVLLREPDAATVSRLFDLFKNPDQLKYTSHLQILFARGYSMEADPGLLERVLSNWESLTPDLKWALWCDPAVRRARPGAIDALSPPDDFNLSYLYSLANDPARQGQLIDYARSHGSSGVSLLILSNAYRQNGFTGPSLAAFARAEALRPPGEESGCQDLAWKVLSDGPSEALSEALADASKLYDHLPRETDRINLVENLASMGPKAAPVAVELLRRETDPIVRLELMVTALSTPGREAEIRTLAAADVDQILSGVTDTGMRYVAALGGISCGLDRYADLVRQVFSAYGTPADIPKIQEYFSALLIPDTLRSGKDAINDVNCRDRLKAGILESIDAIRARN